VRQATGWIVGKAANLDPDDQSQLDQVLARCPELDAAHSRVRAFAVMMDTRDSDSLRDWIERTEATGLAPLRSFARGYWRSENVRRYAVGVVSRRRRKWVRRFSAVPKPQRAAISSTDRPPASNRQRA
jgi:hypothetical protein